ncbi:MAG: carboxylating nicotinate-nucleotide diphosphorylase [bacterium]
MNIYKYVGRGVIENIVMEAVKEDKALSDITTQMCVADDMMGIGIIKAKQDGILSGVQITELVLQTFGPAVVSYKTEDGSSIKSGDELAVIKGKLRGILSSERIILNFIQRMSGIATQTNIFVKTAESKNIKILDTRKTTPGLRYIEKYAVLCGGGVNHRMNLADEIMIKDNHLTALKHNLEIIDRMKNKYPQKKIVVEVDNVRFLDNVLNYPTDRIMLDNMKPAQIKKAVKRIGGACEIEVSGNITEENIKKYLIDGIDYISMGKLTHSYRSLDISMDIEHAESQ